MVYTGVPSRGCYLCRSRKIKCDETKPCCNRCRKIKRQCPGYPVLAKSHFRPYTEIRKPVRKETSHSSSSSSNDEEEYLFNHWGAYAAYTADAASSPLDSTIKITLQDAASCHFLSNWVLLSPPGTNRGIFEFLLPISRQAAQGSPFHLAFKACSLSSFARRGLDPAVERQAISFYVKALAATSDALSRPSVATCDATLATVMLLAIYEIQSASTHGIQGWSFHVSGSMQLMNSRSWKRLDTDLGMGIFVAVRVKLILLGLLQGKPPPTSSEWWGKGTFKDRYALVGLHLTTKTTEMRNELENLLDLDCATLDDFDQLSVIMAKCQALEEHFRKWPDTLPEYFKFGIAAWIHASSANPAKMEALPGPVHSYRGPWVGGIWSMVRTSRLILVNSMFRCSALIHQRTDLQSLPEYATLAQRCADVIGEAMAGVPYHLGWFRNRTALLPTMPSFACGQDGTESSLAAFLALLPLTTMQDHDFATEDQRLFAKGRLQFMAHQFGLRSAAFAEKSTGLTPSTKILQDYDSRSAQRWRRLRLPVTEVDVAETLQNEYALGPTTEPEEDGRDTFGSVTQSTELTIHSRSQWGDRAQPPEKGPC
ncbi:negative acting factor [Beauveria bassiana ARSEF 2860]|uniref:Negative acting factor n=1 Tax=Beauveria bassiana (strain ARSEF 2860) TaxID=655819 RepID=J5K9Q1_BEAB2|nr:negative acting factor [Beauveria bassiana ARSEF 2860]EJP70871.1 negative acting factor [Beauveria bassiana ARSEF 2860]